MSLSTVREVCVLQAVALRTSTARLDKVNNIPDQSVAGIGISPVLQKQRLCLLFALLADFNDQQTLPALTYFKDAVRRNKVFASGQIPLNESGCYRQR
jgi:hypothetical protein